VLQIVEPVMHGLHWPDAVLSFVVVALAAGFPVVIALAWIFDVSAGVVTRTPPSSNLSRSRIALALGVIAIVSSAPGLLWYFIMRKPAGPAVAGATGAVATPGRRRIPVGGSPSRGPGNAPVTIVEFGDFQCPYTKQGELVLHKLFEKYPDKIRLVWKDTPAGVHLDADDAAAFAREALRQKGPEGFWRVHDKLLAAAPALGAPVLERIAAEEGLEVGAIRAALREGRYRAAIDADVDLAQASGYRGTPAFFINGRGTRDDDPELLQRFVSEELAEARQRLAAGVPPRALYDDFQSKADSTPTPVERMALPDPDRRPARGGPVPTAVLVHEFCDLSLLRCAWMEPPIRKTLASYGEEVRLVWWDVSDPQQALSARVITAAIAAGNEGFWKMHDAILARQWRERFEQPPPETLSPEVLRGLAKETGVNMDVYDYAIGVGLGEDEKRQLAQARSLAHAGQIVIDGEVYSGFAPPHVWRKAIDRTLARRR